MLAFAYDNGMFNDDIGFLVGNTAMPVPELSIALLLGLTGMLSLSRRKFSIG